MVKRHSPRPDLPPYMFMLVSFFLLFSLGNGPSLAGLGEGHDLHRPVGSSAHFLQHISLGFPRDGGPVIGFGQFWSR